MDLLTTRPRHRKQTQPAPQRRRPSSASSTSTQNNKTLPKRPSSTATEKKLTPLTPSKRKVLTETNQQRIQNPPQAPTARNVAPVQKKPAVETKHSSTQTELALIEKKLHDSLLHIVEQTLEVIQKNLQRVLDDKSKSIDESYAKLIDDILDKIDTKKNARFQENKKVLEVKLKDYKHHIKQKHKMEKEKEKERENAAKEIASVKSERTDNLRLKRQFSLEKLTKLSLGLKQPTQESVETPKLKRQFSFDNIPTKHQGNARLVQAEDINELKSRLSKVMGHFKSTEMLNGNEEEAKQCNSNVEEINHIELVQNVEEYPAVASFPLEDQQYKSPDIQQESTIFFDEITVLEGEPVEEFLQEELILPPEDFQGHPYDSKRDQELEYLKSLKGKLSSLVVGHRTSESSSEASLQEKPNAKNNPNDTKKIKELKTKLTQLMDMLKSPEKVDYEKAEKKLLKLKVKYINIRFVQNDEFQGVRSEAIQMFNEAEKIIQAGKHGLNYTEEENRAPRGSVASECSSLDVTSSEASCTESPHIKLERLKIMLEQMICDIEDAEILNYDLIFNELNKYQEEFSDIKTQMLPETGPIRQEVFNLLIEAYNLLEDKNTK